MKKFRFMIDGEGVALCVPAEGNEDDIRDIWGVGPGDRTFHELRARLNWDRGCYYMEADITDDQEAVLINLVVKQKDWTGAQSYVEGITGRNFETETGYDNPFDPDYEFPKTREEANAETKRRNMWLDRAGLAMLGSLKG